MRYFSDKSPEEILNEIRSSLCGDFGNIRCNLHTTAPTSILDQIKYAIESAFKALLKNMKPETDIDDIILK